MFEEAAGMLSCWMHDDGNRARVVAWLEHLAPENGHRERFKSEAAKAIRREGRQIVELNIGHELWGNSQREYNGAIQIVALTARETK